MAKDKLVFPDLPSVPHHPPDSFFYIRDHIRGYSNAHRDILEHVLKVLQLVMVMPVTNTTSERSFSALCQYRVKNDLRAPMTQERLNNLLILQNWQTILFPTVLTFLVL